MQGEAKRLLPSYGRRRGRRLRPGRQELIDSLLPQLEVPLPDAPLVDLAELFSGEAYGDYWLEIGFGGGEHMVQQALDNPHVGIIGCELFINGIAALLSSVRDHGLRNIRIYRDDARKLLEKLPENSISRVFIPYPDPWPKARHRKRRLVSAALLTDLARVMKQGAQLRLTTDDEDYGTWMLERLLTHPAFKWTAQSCDGWLNPPEGWMPTRYEQKALKAGRVPTYLNFIKDSL